MRYDHAESKLLEQPFPLAKDLYRKLQAGEEVSFSFTGEEIGFRPEDDNEYKLYFTGEADIPPAYRCEPQYPVLYRRICESLVREGETYRLRAASDAQLPRAAFYKVNDLPADVKSLFFSCDVAGIYKKGDCRFEIEVYRKNGKTRLAYDEDAETKVRIPVAGAGRYEREIATEGETDFVLVSLRLDGFEGELLFDSPHLTDGQGREYLQPFCMEPRDLTPKKWLGMNFSKIERPAFEIRLNGQTAFQGESFERIFRWPSHTIPLPKALLRSGENTVTFRYIGGYLDPLPFTLRDAAVLVSPTEQGIIACGRYASPEFGVLVRLKESGKVLCRASRAEIVPAAAESVLPAGLHVLRFRSAFFVGGAEIEVQIGEKHYTAQLERFIEKDCRDVITGTSDSIYNRVDRQWMDDYISWYLFNRLGNMFTFRTSYRWSGTDRIEEGIYDRVIGMLGDYGVYTAIMIDGRELPSAPANKKHYFGRDPHFLGYQSHEHDGSFYYWGTGKHTADEAFYYEILSRVFECEGIEPLRTLVRDGQDYYKYYDARRAKNMKEGAEYFVENISRIKYDATRHSGPSVFFKYFFEAGVKWLAAELMYGCIESCVAALRGASLANGQQGYGGHMAVQWSTTPHDDIYRYRRYFNSLMLAYTNGLTEINTEEGCYRLEEIYADHERNSSACRHHASVQAAFCDFVQTHTRRGSFKTNIAVIHGKYDSFSMFNTVSIWGMEGSCWRDSERSWDLLKIFYPHAVLDVVYRHNCPHEPVGFFTETPYGGVDIVPDSAPSEFLARYPYVILFGYNCATHDFNARALEYVKNGGTLLATLSHFSDCLDHAEANAGMGGIVDDERFRELTGCASVVQTQEGLRLAEADGSVPAVWERKVGKGRLILFNTMAYPAHESVRERYAEAVRAIAGANAAAERAKGWAEPHGWVSASVFDAPDRRTLYCVNVNWWADGDPAERVTLWNAGHSYDTDVLRDCVCIASVFGDTMFVTQDMSVDILGYDGQDLRVQGRKGSRITVCRGGRTFVSELPADGVSTLTLRRVASAAGALAAQPSYGAEERGTVFFC